MLVPADFSFSDAPRAALTAELCVRDGKLRSALVAKLALAHKALGAVHLPFSKPFSPGCAGLRRVRLETSATLVAAVDWIVAAEMKAKHQSMISIYKYERLLELMTVTIVLINIEAVWWWSISPRASWARIMFF